MEFEYSEITTEKMGRGCWVASIKTTKPIRSTINMKGKTEEIAKQKLELFLNNEPYKHLDNL